MIRLIIITLSSSDGSAIYCRVNISKGNSVTPSGTAAIANRWHRSLTIQAPALVRPYTIVYDSKRRFVDDGYATFEIMGMKSSQRNLQSSKVNVRNSARTPATLVLESLVLDDVTSTSR